MLANTLCMSNRRRVFTNMMQYMYVWVGGQRLGTGSRVTASGMHIRVAWLEVFNFPYISELQGLRCSNVVCTTAH
jgi:hypothetical protein